MLTGPSFQLAAAASVVALSGCVPGDMALGPSEQAFVERMSDGATQACVSGDLDPAHVVPRLAALGFADDGNSFGPTILIASAPGGRIRMSALASDPCWISTEFSGAGALERGSEAALARLGYVQTGESDIWQRGESRFSVTIRTHSSHTTGSSGSQLRVTRP